MSHEDVCCALRDGVFAEKRVIEIGLAMTKTAAWELAWYAADNRYRDGLPVEVRYLTPAGHESTLTFYPPTEGRFVSPSGAENGE